MDQFQKLQRHSWLDRFKEFLPHSPLPEIELRDYVMQIDNLLHEQWQLGRNIILFWSSSGNNLILLVIQYFQLVDRVDGAQIDRQWISDQVASKKFIPENRLYKVAAKFGVVPQIVELPLDPIKILSESLISELVRRYSVSLVQNRAVALLDAVGFSLLTPLEQVTQLNSLSYSVNAAYSKLLNKEIEIAFARTTTGDGFYIWSRNTTLQGNFDLYHFIQLILADNAIARSKSHNQTVPLLRTCIHIGSHYEFYQEEGLSPTSFSYIVGDVTIALARMIEKALPGQILIGDFSIKTKLPDSDQFIELNTVDFIERSLETLSDLNNVELSGDKVKSIKCYLTGPQQTDGTFGVNRYKISDKHGLQHTVYNAKVNIERFEKPVIFLGIQEQELKNFDATEIKEL